MKPKDYVKILQSNLRVNHIITPKQFLESKKFLDAGFEHIGNKLDENFEDMTPEACDIANKMQSFLLVFLEHSNNFALLKKMEVS